MISHSRTWLELKVGDVDPCHQHVMEVILQVRPGDVAWFQEHATTARQELMHLVSTVILPRSPCGEDELEAYYRKQGFVLPLSIQQQQKQQKNQKQQQKQNKKVEINRSKAKRAANKSNKNEAAAAPSATATAVAAKKKETRKNDTKKRKRSAADSDNDDDEEDDEEAVDDVKNNKGESVEKTAAATTTTDNNDNNHNNNVSKALDVGNNETYHQAVGEILRIVYRTEPISTGGGGTSTSSSKLTSSSQQQSCTLFMKKNDSGTTTTTAAASKKKKKTNNTNNYNNSTGLLQQLPKLSHRFWLWCYPIEKTASTEENKDGHLDLTQWPGWSRQDMIPMASLFRPPADYV